MSDPQTIREHLEAIRDERDRPLNGAVFEEIVRYCEHITQHAVAALDLLGKRHAYRCGPGCWDCAIRDEPWRSTDVRVAVVDDPAPRGDAE